MVMAHRSKGWVKAAGQLVAVKVTERKSLFGNPMKVISEIEYRYEFLDNAYMGHKIYPYGLGPVGWEVGEVLRNMPAIGQQTSVFVDPANPFMSALINKYPFGILTIFGVVVFVGLGASSFAVLAYQLGLLRVLLILLLTLLPALLIWFFIYKVPAHFVPNDRRNVS